ncbi:MAG TPA: hypothetical protein VH352_17710 [Pseudonocardiaceae bacterium]|nr:hypothetical protein [Pseudonocardiaceae bacterium]
MPPNPKPLRVEFTAPPDPDSYAAVALVLQALLAMARLDRIATVHQDPDVVSDEDLGALADRWADASPWG